MEKSNQPVCQTREEIADKIYLSMEIKNRVKIKYENFRESELVQTTVNYYQNHLSQQTIESWMTQKTVAPLTYLF